MFYLHIMIICTYTLRIQTVTGVFSALSSVQLSFSDERPVLMHDLKAGAHGRTSFFLANSIIEMPVAIVLALLTTVIVYWTIGFSNVASPPAFWRFVLTTSLLALGAVAFGLMIAASAKTQAAALSITPIILIPLLIFGGASICRKY